MFYNLIMIQWYNKSSCNWSCSFPDMSISFFSGGLLFPCNCNFLFFSFPKKENKSHDWKKNPKTYDRQKVPGCNPGWLPIHSHNREKERQIKGIGKKKKKKRYKFHVLKAGPWWRWAPVFFNLIIMRRREAQGIVCTVCHLVSYSSPPTGCYWGSLP